VDAAVWVVLVTVGSEDVLEVPVELVVAVVVVVLELVVAGVVGVVVVVVVVIGSGGGGDGWGAGAGALTVIVKPTGPSVPPAPSATEKVKPSLALAVPVLT
jgi:hypothetical protein